MAITLIFDSVLQEYFSLKRVEERKRSPPSLSSHNQFCVTCTVISAAEVCAIVQCTLEGFSEIHEDSILDSPDTEPAFLAFFKGQEAAPFLYSAYVMFTLSGPRELRNIFHYMHVS